MALRNANPGPAPTSKTAPPWKGGTISNSPGPVKATAPRAGNLGVARPSGVPTGSTESLGLSGPMGSMPCEDMAIGDSPDNDADD